MRSDVTSADLLTNKRMTDEARQAMKGGVRSEKKNDAAVSASDAKKASVMRVAKPFPIDELWLDLGVPLPQVKQTFSPLRRMPLQVEHRVMSN